MLIRLTKEGGELANSDGSHSLKEIVLDEHDTIEIDGITIRHAVESRLAVRDDQ